MTHTVLRGSAWAVLLAGVCAPAYAQRRASTGGSSGQQLTVMASASASADFAPTGDGAPRASSQYGSFSGSINYRLAGLTVSGNANSGYDPARRTLTGLDVNGGAGWGFALGRSLNVSLQYGVRRSTRWFDRLLPASNGFDAAVPATGRPAPVPVESVVVDTPTDQFRTNESALISHDGGVSMSYAITRSTSVSLGGSLAATQPGASAADGWRSEAVRVGLRQGITRGAALRLGYGYRIGRYELSDGGRAVGMHDIDIGIDYAKPLSLTRRTSLNFGSGSSLTGRGGAGASESEARQLRLNGNVALSHQIGRTWQAQLTYRRGVDFVERFAAPVASDGAVTSLSGRFSRRVALGADAGASRGRVGDSDSFITYTGGVAARVTLWGGVGLQTGYSYVSYSGALPVDSRAAGAMRFGRHGVQVGVTIGTAVGK